MTTTRTFVPLEEATKTCELHGDYLSTLLELRPSEAPPELRQHWTNCPPCNDDWQAEADATEAEMRDGALLKDELRRKAHEAAGIPKRFMAVTIFDWLHPMDKQRRVWTWVRDYCHAFHEALETGRSMALIGQPGTGKTHLAIGVLAFVLKGGRTGRYTTAMDMLGRIKNTYNARAKETETEVIEDLATVDLLVIDELGKQLDTNYESAQLFRIIDRRYRDMKPVVLVSNLDRAALAEFTGAAIIDRLTENGGKVLGFGWASHRSTRKST